MLAFLAAVVPIIGSLYVGCSFLAQQHALVHEQKVRIRIRALVENRYNSELARSNARPGPLMYDDALAERNRFERMLLAANGVTGEGNTWNDVDLQNAMSGTVLPPAERRRQWVLLSTSAAGLILLALDALTRATT